MRDIMPILFLFIFLNVVPLGDTLVDCGMEKCTVNCRDLSPPIDKVNIYPIGYSKLFNLTRPINGDNEVLPLLPVDNRLLGPPLNRIYRAHQVTTAGDVDDLTNIAPPGLPNIIYLSPMRGPQGTFTPKDSGANVFKVSRF
ncbi:hypothetical protein BKA67DRAFT_660591 [Truncatella angustata]|uniref:Uncharacterized protein n=1 Tax=Truncatella angustata TaxID=152316 RepID=A0A9P8UGI6_9PEZI|nr:uncharacterized protein BKA67DRAFT_660591 [Truncatella angustata]KAH6651804.1 hypothetical protein BKA67DRAFT_660591 [Truncatella angustata]KAH8196020.1 hypothetical protein TruAng_009827 [Truncatella angustata]